MTMTDRKTDAAAIAAAFRKIYSAAMEINEVLGRNDGLNESVPENWPLNLSADEFAAECQGMAEHYDALDAVKNGPEQSPVGVILTDNFFRVEHTGGGCLAWRRDNASESHYALITFGDVELGENVQDPEAATWIVGLYGVDGTYGDTVDVIGIIAAIKHAESALMGVS